MVRSPFNALAVCGSTGRSCQFKLRSLKEKNASHRVCPVKNQKGVLVASEAFVGADLTQEVRSLSVVDV